MALGRNIIANIIGRLWVALMNFVFVPIYINFLGVESYGLIGFFVAVLSVFMILDMGLSVTINREFAKNAAASEWQIDSRNLLRSFELIYWLIGLILSAALIFGASTLASDWLKPEKISIQAATNAIQLMGVVVFFRWPQPLYIGALTGLGKQVVQNLVMALGATLQGAGAAIMLWLVSPTIETFFVWQIFAVIFQSTLLLTITWHTISFPGHRPKFAAVALTKLVKFSAGVTGITFLSVFLTQSDKFILSKLLPLNEFGYYALSSGIAGVLTIGSTAIYTAAFPAMARRVATGDTQGVINVYRKSSQLLAAFLFPIGIVICLFSEELITVYTGSADIALKTHVILSFLVAGNVILSVMVLPLALQFAYDWTKLSLYKNIAAVIIYIPFLLIMIDRYGPEGAAFTWMLLALSYFLIEIPLMHRKLIKKVMWPWYFKDIGLSAGVSVSLIGATFAVIPANLPLDYRIVIGVAAGSVAILISVFFTLGTQVGTLDLFGQSKDAI